MRVSAARVALNGVIFLLTCVLGCWLIGRLRPLPEGPGFQPKWKYFRAHRGEFDTIFIGSSRFFHHIIPPQFDAELGRAGIKTKSFNFGCPAMWPPECYYTLRRILALHPPGLKRVFIDLMDIDARLDERNDETMRMAYWHDLRHTWLALRDIHEREMPQAKKLDHYLQHARRCALYLMNLGYGSDLLQRRFQPKPARAEKWLEHAGWQAGQDIKIEGQDLTSYLAVVAAIQRSLPPSPVRPVFRDALTEIIAEVRRAGAEPIFILSPTINAWENYTDIPGGVTVLKFNDPHEYPQFFDPERRYDWWHLNAKGAVEFTSQLAAKVIEQRKAQR